MKTNAKSLINSLQSQFTVLVFNYQNEVEWQMGKLIIFKESMFFALDNKVCSFDGVKNLTLLVASSKQAAQRFCKIVNDNKDIIK